MASSKTVVIEAALDAGCPPDQIKRFLGFGYVPQPKQLLFHAAARKCDKEDGPTIIGTGGTRGGSKTHMIFAQVALDDCQRSPGLKVLYLRKIQKSAGESADDLVYKILRHVPHDYIRTSGKVVFDNESRIIIGGYKNEGDIDKYLGIEYDLIVIEEATQLTRKKIQLIHGSRRTTRDDWRVRSYFSTNPGGIGHAWFKEDIVIPTRENRQKDSIYIHYTYHDNAFIKQAYIDYLKGLTGSLARMWRDGDWDTFAGMALPNFNYDRHVIKPRHLPTHWYRWRAVDYGLHSPFGALWFARDTDIGRIYTYRELYQAELTDTQQARLILEHTPEDEKIGLTYADPAMWSRKTFKEYKFSSADEYASVGVPLMRADNDPTDGLMRVARLLEPLADGMPGWMIFDNCPDLIRTLQNLPVDEDHPDKAETKNVEDHLYDCARYGFTRYKLGVQSPTQNFWSQMPLTNPIYEEIL
jgi:PBSX family phage terminase large subunit